MEHFARINYSSLFDETQKATHIVTKIIYGANAIFAFRSEAGSNSEKDAVQRKLKKAVKHAFGKKVLCFFCIFSCFTVFSMVCLCLLKKG